MADPWTERNKTKAGREAARKSDQILRDCQTLVDEYGGSVWQASRDAHDLERRLLVFYCVGPVTANIFLRELRPFWPKADLEPLPIVVAVAASVGIDLARYERKSLTFVRIEAGLIRLRHVVSGSRRLPRSPRFSANLAAASVIESA